MVGRPFFGFICPLEARVAEKPPQLFLLRLPVFEKLPPGMVCGVVHLPSGDPLSFFSYYILHFHPLHLADRRP